MNGYSYDFTTGKFCLYEKHGFIFDFTLRKPRVIVKDKSSTGKTYLSELINVSNRINFNSNLEDFPAVAINVKTDISVIVDLMDLKNKLIIIDDADLLLRRNSFLLNRIIGNTQNDYLIFTRGWFEFHVYPHNIGYFSRIWHIVELKYYVSPRRLAL
jgi:hypothetical protein